MRHELDPFDGDFRKMFWLIILINIGIVAFGCWAIWRLVVHFT